MQIMVNNNDKMNDTNVVGLKQILNRPADAS